MRATLHVPPHDDNRMIVCPTPLYVDSVVEAQRACVPAVRNGCVDDSSTMVSRCVEQQLRDFAPTT